MPHPALLLALSLLAGCTPKEAPRESPRSPERPEPSPAAADVDVDVTPEDDVLRAVLTDERFAMYLHPDAPGRVPVVVCGPARPTNLGFELFGAPVESKERADPDDGAACAEIMQLSVDGDAAAVELRYAVEGIVGSFHLERRGGRWSVGTASLTER